MIDEIIQKIIRYNEFWHARFHFFSINVNELNKQWIPCKFGNIILDLLMKSLNYNELDQRSKFLNYWGKQKNKRMKDFHIVSKTYYHHGFITIYEVSKMVIGNFILKINHWPI